jgi:hypothetical protein
MAFKNVQKLPNFTGISPTALSTSVVPSSGIYFDLLLRVLASDGSAVSVANMKSDVKLLRALIDGQTIVEAPAELLLMLQNYYYGKDSATGDLNSDGQLPLFFSRDYLRQADQAAAFALGTRGIDQFTLEIECGADVNTAAHTSKIEVRGNKISNEDAAVGAHVRLQRFPQNFASTGLDEITDLPKEPNVATVAYHIFYDDSTTDLLDVKMIANASDQITLDEASNNTILEKAGRTVQKNASGNSIFTIEFGQYNTAGSNFNQAGIQDLRLQLNWATAAPGNYTIYREAIFNGVST